MMCVKTIALLLWFMSSVASGQVHDTSCQNLGGYCSQAGNCFGRMQCGLCGSICGRSSPVQCCIPQGLSAGNSDQQCKNTGGNCMFYWECQGQTAENLCGATAALAGKKCCYQQKLSPPANPEEACLSKGGKCMFDFECPGTTSENLCGDIAKLTGVKCCLQQATARNPDYQCIEKGGTCKYSWNCAGQHEQGLCKSNPTQLCCLKSSHATSPGNDEQTCLSRGGECMFPIQCSGTTVENLCGDIAKLTGAKCCLKQESNKNQLNPDKRCTMEGGSCQRLGAQCKGVIKYNLCKTILEQCCIVFVADTTGASVSLSIKDPNQKCTDAGGFCDGFNKLCLGIRKFGLCGNIFEHCCIPLAPATATPKISQCKLMGGSCIRMHESCPGQVRFGLCDRSEKCCLYIASAQDPDYECIERGGACKYQWNCAGQSEQGLCKSNPNQRCCLESATTTVTPKKSQCKLLGGSCIRMHESCLGQVRFGLCDRSEKCCLYIASAKDPDHECIERGGACKYQWNCAGQSEQGLCKSNPNQWCCLESAPATEKPKPAATPRVCKDLGGSCMFKEEFCAGKPRLDLCGNRKKCCIDTKQNLDQQCAAYGGTCKYNWVCEGRGVENVNCGDPNKECCVRPGEPPTPKPEPIPPSGNCKRYTGGQCSSSFCPGKFLGNVISGIQLCDENNYCCLEDPDKKCKHACGECVDDTKCNGKIVKGLCGGKKVCCFKIDKRKHAGCIKKGGANAVCMKIDCDGYFVKCNKGKQSNFCPDHKREDCCFAKGKKPIAGAANCKAAGGKCDCNPCDGTFYPNTKGNQLCEAGKKCCIIDPENKCKDGGGRCQIKNIKCKGPYLSGYCGPGNKVCCFEPDFMKLIPKGANAATAAGAGLDADKVKGTAASDALVKEDLAHLKRLKAKINRVAAKTGIDAAIIAGIISRETRGGRPEHTKNPKSFGAMQLDTAKKVKDPLSEEHIQEATEHFIKILGKIFGKHPCWSLENKLKGAIAGYNFGEKNVKTIDKMDEGSAKGDYSDDVVARAKWLRSNGHF